MVEEKINIDLGFGEKALPNIVHHVCICGKGEYVNDCPSFEKYYESLLFFDKSRMDFVNEVCPRLRMLTQNTLRGQKNGFLVLGIQGIGKSQLLLSLGNWVTAMGGSKTGFYYLSIGAVKHGDPHSSRLLNMRYIIHNMSMRLGWNPPAECWETMQEAWDWMIAGGYVALIVLDEFHKQYKEENTCGLFHDLYCIGNNSGHRPIVVILNGSSALMHSLVFRLLKKGSDVTNQYPGYATSESLNATKFLPVTLLPLCNTDDMKKAVATLHDQSTTLLNVTSDDADEIYHTLCFNTRGIIRHFEAPSDRIKYSNARFSHKTACFTSELSPLFTILWIHVVSQVSSDLIARCLSGKSDMEYIPEVPVRNFFDKGYSASDLYDFADKGFIRFYGGVSVGFVHPADIMNCVTFFGVDALNPQPSVLSAAEEVSLLYPHANAICEINEKLVCESLCEKGLTVASYGHLKFSPTESFCFTGVVRTTTHQLTPYRMNESSLNSSQGRGLVKKKLLTTQHIAAELRKEWPDETGGDLIAVFAVKGFSRVRRGIKYIVVRVQVKLGFSSSPIGDPVQKMKDSEEIIAESLGVSKNDVDFIRVIWTSRPVSTCECALGVNGQNIVINSENMLAHWSTRCSDFVRKHQLSKYGYRG